jgi:hypothetical protein
MTFNLAQFFVDNCLLRKDFYQKFFFHNAKFWFDAANLAIPAESSRLASRSETGAGAKRNRYPIAMPTGNHVN